LSIEERIKIKNNDLILLGTDGLFDNIFTEEIIGFISIGL